MFYDWLTVTQCFDFDLPVLSDNFMMVFETSTGEHVSTRQMKYVHKGSFCTSVVVQISGRKITVSGNPSRYNRLDNLFGLTTLEECFSVYNSILSCLGLPLFTKGTEFIYHQCEKSKKQTKTSNGAVIQELHVTTNLCVGSDCVKTYIKSVGTIFYRYMRPRLHGNGETVDWLSGRNHAGKASTLIYPCIYNKSFEFSLNLLPKIKKKYGVDSPEFAYVNKLMLFCKEKGVVRFEQKLKSAFLRKYNFRFYGLFDESDIDIHHKDFLGLDKKLKITHMNIENISSQLIRENICTGTRASNTTALYAIDWMHGGSFDLKKSQVKIHRSRLRKIGIDIAYPCDISKHSTVHIRDVIEIVKSPLSVPSWYLPSTFALAA